MCCIEKWVPLMAALYDFGQPVPGTDAGELLSLVEHDYDDVDRMLLDFETIGGA